LAAIAITGACSGSALQHLSSFDVLELKSLDFRFLHASHPEKADTSVVLVAIDQNSLDFYATQSVSWPWPREFYGLLVDYLKMGGAKVIAFDMDFSRSDLERLETDARESDHAFAEAIGRGGNVVLARCWRSRSPATNKAVKLTSDISGADTAPYSGCQHTIGRLHLCRNFNYPRHAWEL